MGSVCVVSRFVWGWSLLGPPLEQGLRRCWSQFKKAREEFERDFFR